MTGSRPTVLGIVMTAITTNLIDSLDASAVLPAPRAEMEEGHE
jgi:hypothetical protein